MPFSFLSSANLDRSKALSIQVYEILLKAIVDQDLPPGTAIVKEEVGRALGVSRTPVRDAIAKLPQER